ASFQVGAVSSESLVATFGARLATATLAASATPLPITLAGTVVKVRDRMNNERPAPLVFVSPAQVNYLIPTGTANGTAAITVTNGDGAIAAGMIVVAPVAPGLFSANANGSGVAAAAALRVRADGSRQFEPIARFDPAQNRFVPIPLDLGPPEESLFLVLFGTGVRWRGGLETVTAKIGETEARVLYAGAQSDFPGLDQINVLLPRSLAGRGEVEVALTVDSKSANAVSVSVK